MSTTKMKRQSPAASPRSGIEGESEREVTQQETHEMVVGLHSQYQYDYIVAVRRASKIQRELSRAEHEANRLQAHLQRIESFCKKNNINLETH